MRQHKNDSSLVVLARDEQGLSLVEITVVLGLMGLLAVGALKLFEVNFKASRTVAVNYELASFKDELRQFLSEPKNCIASFQKSGNSFNNFSSATNLLFSNLKRNDGSANVVIQYNTSDKYGDGALKIKSIKLGPYQSNGPTDQFQGKTTLSIEYEKQGLIFASNLSVHELKLNTTLKGGGGTDKNQLVSCSVKQQENAGGPAGDCATKGCVRAEIDSVLGNQCFEVDGAGSCSGDYLQAGTKSKTRCLYVIRDDFNHRLGSTSGPSTVSAQAPGPSMATVVMDGVGTCPPAVATIPAWGSSGGEQSHSAQTAQMVLTQSTSTVKICCRKFPPP